MVSLAGVGLLVVVAACGGGGSEGTTGSTPEDETPDAPLQEVKVMMLPAVPYRLPVLMAEKEGFFAEVGIELEIVVQPGRVTTSQALAATGANVAVSTLAAVAAAEQAGSPAAFFCGTQDVIETSLFARADSGLPSMDDGAPLDAVVEAMRGRSIGIQTPIGSPLHLVFQAALDSAGVTDVDLVSVGTQPQIVEAAISNGDVEVIQTVPPLTQRFLLDDRFTRVMLLPEHLDAYAQLWGSGFWAEPDWIDGNGELASSFCDAVGKGMDFIKDDANAAEVDALLMADTGVSAEVAELFRAESVPTFDTAISRESFDRTAQLLIDVGVLKAEPPVGFDELVRQPRG